MVLNGIKWNLWYMQTQWDYVFSRVNDVYQSLSNNQEEFEDIENYS